MTKKITKLTEEQSSRMAEWRDRWIRIGLSTEPANRGRFEGAVVECYRAAGLEKPKAIIWVSSPVVGALAAPAAALLIELIRNPPKSPRAVDSAVGSAVYSAVDSAVYSAVDSETSIVRFWHYWVGGQLWPAWHSFATFFREVCGLDLGADINGRLGSYAATCDSAGYWWPNKDFVMVSERPSTISMDDRGRLHREDGPAYGSRDGWGIYSWHGVTVPREVVVSPETLTAKRILEEKNAEVRRVMLERFGGARFVEESGAKAVASDAFGSLYQLPLEGDEPLTLVKVRNSTPEPDGTVRTYWLRVHPELRPMLGGNRLGEPQKLTAVNAVASSFGLRGEEYRPAKET